MDSVETMKDYCQLIGIVFDKPIVKENEDIERIVKFANQKPDNHPLKKLEKNWSCEGGFQLPLTEKQIQEFNQFRKNCPLEWDVNGWRLYLQVPMTSPQNSRQLRFNSDNRLRVKDGLSWSRKEIQSFIEMCQELNIKAKACYCQVEGDWEYYMSS
jgi:hypothetical protein